MKSITSNNNEIIETNFQLYFVDIYIVVDPSAPPIIDIAGASSMRRMFWGIN
jgi:hypothetical protein